MFLIKEDEDKLLVRSSPQIDLVTFSSKSFELILLVSFDRNDSTPSFFLIIGLLGDTSFNVGNHITIQGLRSQFLICVGS